MQLNENCWNECNVEWIFGTFGLSLLKLQSFEFIFKFATQLFHTKHSNLSWIHKIISCITYTYHNIAVCIHNICFLRFNCENKLKILILVSFNLPLNRIMAECKWAFKKQMKNKWKTNIGYCLPNLSQFRHNDSSMRSFKIQSISISFTK